MILLVGALVIAQAAALVLTLAFPPQPPPQHSLEDIARVMEGRSVETGSSRPLLRAIVDEAPHPEGPGWLSAAGPRDQLAALLHADTADVVLMFYVPLPMGAQPMGPRPSPDRRKPGSVTSPPATPEPDALNLRDPEAVSIAVAFAPARSTPPRAIARGPGRHRVPVRRVRRGPHKPGNPVPPRSPVATARAARQSPISRVSARARPDPTRPCPRPAPPRGPPGPVLSSHHRMPRRRLVPP